MRISHVVSLVMCFSSLGFEFIDTSGFAYLNANGAAKWHEPWESPIQTYMIEEAGCSVFFVSPTVGITAAHCFEEIVMSTTEFSLPTAFPYLIRRQEPYTLYAADSWTEISKIKSAFITRLFFDDLRRITRNNQETLPEGDFAFIHINPEIEMHEDVLFASQTDFDVTHKAWTAGCKCVNIKGAENSLPRCCIMELTYFSESEISNNTYKATVKTSSPMDNLNDFGGGYSGGPVTIDDENGRKYVVGYYIGYINGKAVVERLDKYLPLIKDVILFDKATASGEKNDDYFNKVYETLDREYITIIFEPPTASNPTSPTAT